MGKITLKFHDNNSPISTIGKLFISTRSDFFIGAILTKTISNKLISIKLFLLFMILMNFVMVSSAQSWNTLNGSTTENLHSVNFRLSYQNTMSGWVVGDNNTGISTQDGGNNWYTSIVTNVNNYCVYFTIVDFGHVVGSNSLLWYTDVGGLWWYPHSNAASANYYGVWFAYRDTGFVAGENGVILKSIDEGVNWNVNASGTAANLRSIVGIDVNNIWAAGDSGTITHTSNGGTNWFPQLSGTAQNLHSISFTSLNKGWACGDSGTILFTSNGGTNWGSQNSNTTLNLNGIYFVDSLHGWAVGDSGIIIQTVNGGMNWTNNISNTTEKLNAVNFYDLQNGWAVGNNGTIRRYDSTSVKTTANEIENNQLTIEIYPNPASDFLIVKASGHFSNQSMRYEVVDEMGRIVLAGTFKISTNINVQSLSKGTYFFQAAAGKNKISHSFTK